MRVVEVIHVETGARTRMTEARLAAKSDEWRPVTDEDRRPRLETDDVQDDAALDTADAAALDAPDADPDIDTSTKPPIRRRASSD